MILQSNLEVALKIAIREQRRVERGAGYERDSALVAGWVEALEELRNRELEIRY